MSARTSMLALAALISATFLRSLAAEEGFARTTIDLGIVVGPKKK